MAIELETPLIVAPVPAKTFSEGWVSLLCISSPTQTSGNVRVELSAYDPKTGEIAPGGAVETITTADMMAAVMDPTFPEAKKLYDAVVAVVEPFRAWVKKREDAKNVTP